MRPVALVRPAGNSGSQGRSSARFLFAFLPSVLVFVAVFPLSLLAPWRLLLMRGGPLRWLPTLILDYRASLLGTGLARGCPLILFACPLRRL